MHRKLPISYHASHGVVRSKNSKENGCIKLAELIINLQKVLSNNNLNSNKLHISMVLGIR